MDLIIISRILAWRIPAPGGGKDGPGGRKKFQGGSCSPCPHTSRDYV